MMYRVQRAGVGSNAPWKTVCTNADEAYAREVYQRQLKLHSAGRFRLLDALDKVLAESQARGLFQQADGEEEQRLPTYYAPAAASPKPG